jgi:hypothetical protein
MTATAVIEILVIGVQAELWLALLACALSPDGHRTALSTLKDLKEWAPLGTVVALALAYGLGVIVDRWADSLFPRTPNEKLPLMRLIVMHKSEGVAYRFLKRRSGNEQDVDAYLVKMTRTKAPRERRRAPCWCSPSSARILFAKGHNTKEHHRVLAAALRRLSTTARSRH